ncbi:MAG: hypothetical protein OEW12_02535 [Deltaproteobacteria bacterium]|nr:hypothetical protein [Deltaproteobacteria bacterium]
MAKKTYMETLYDKEDAGTITFQRREEVEPEIKAYLSVLAQLKEDMAQDPAILEGLAQIEVKLQALRISNAPLDQIRQNLNALVHVPIGQGKSLRLDSFRKTSAKGQLATSDDYLERVARLVENTLGNLTHLLISWPDDTILLHFLSELQQAQQYLLQNKGDYHGLKARMDQISQSPDLWYYTEKKKEFLVEWLRPFQEMLGGAIDTLNEKEMADALKKVDKLREKKLAELTHLILETNLDPFRPHNHEMHPIINGHNADFWGSSEVRNEFINLMSKVINHFTFNLDDRFLLFKTKDGQFAYLAGFADDSFQNSQVLHNGRLAIYPHIKVFVADTASGRYNEITAALHNENLAEYYSHLKTAVVPFLVAISKMVGFNLSPQIKESFDMWI